MTLTEFIDLKMSPCKAFVLGMIFPLYTEKVAKNGKKYVLAQVRHSAKHITENDILEHHRRIKLFLRTYNLVDQIQVVSNQTEEFGNLSGAFRGFTLLIEKENLSQDGFNEILLLVDSLKNADIEIKKYFLKGVFDGRGSFDTNSKLLVVDYELDDYAFDIFSSIIVSLGFEIIPNKRNIDSKRHTQFRIKKSSLKKYKTEIGFFSVRRNFYLEEILHSLQEV